MTTKTTSTGGTGHRGIGRARPGPDQRAGAARAGTSSPTAAARRSSRRPRCPTAVTVVVGDLTDADHRDRARGGGRARAAGSTCWSTTPAPSARCRCDRWPRSTIADLTQVWRTNIGAPARPDVGAAAVAARRRTACCCRSAPTRRSSHYETWGLYGASKAALDHVDADLRRRDRRSRRTPSTPATCAPRCTRTPSPARTSPTGRCRRPWCRTCSRCWTRGPSRAATARPTSEARRMTHAAPRRRAPTSRASAFAPQPAEDARRSPATRCGCWSATPGRPRRTRSFRDLPDHLRAGDVLVVNNSATVAAEVDAGAATARRSWCTSRTALDDGDRVVELRSAPDAARAAARRAARGRGPGRRRAPDPASSRGPPARRPRPARATGCGGPRCAATSTASSLERPPDRLRLPRPALPARRPTRPSSARGPGSAEMAVGRAPVHRTSSSPGW